MEKEKTPKKRRNSDFSFQILKKLNYKKERFPSALYEKKNSFFHKNRSKDLGKSPQFKRASKKYSKNLSFNNIYDQGLFFIKNQKEIKKHHNFNLTGLSPHDALYLGLNQNNKGIRANDISCYLSNTAYFQPEETKYKLLEKNIQNTIVNLSMEILDKINNNLENEITNNSDNNNIKKKKISKSSKKIITKLKDRSNKYLVNFRKTSTHDTSIFMHMKEQQLEKMRKITPKKALYDSMAEDESDENLDEEGSGLSPETLFIDIYDCFLLICSLFCLFYVPILLAKSKLKIGDGEYLILFMIYFSEIIYISDLILGFFRCYYNNELKLVSNNMMIFKHYLFGYFLIDLIEAIPLYTILKYCYLNRDEKKDNIHYEIFYNEKYISIKIMICLKALKIFKINDRKNNRVFFYFNNKFSENYLSERIYQICNFVITIISVLNIFICFHIYMGKLSYPNWILSSKLQDKSFIEIYLSSLYFILATMTSVGYGDIVCINRAETFFQIILLSIGIVAYSWIISTVGDYVKNESRATIKYNKDITQLEEIRISYPNMPFKLYNKIHQHLHRLLKQQEKYDSNILINSLPLTIKNNLLFEIHKEIIQKFIFFRGCENSDFILKILTHFIPLNSKKNAFLIKEGEIIENIFFVKDGRLSLEAAIDLDNIEESVERYLEYQFEGISSIVETSFEPSINKIINEEKKEKKKKIKNSKELFNLISRQTQLIGDISYMHESNIEGEIGKCDLDGENEDLEQGNHQFLHILDILKNEHFGELYMFLNKPCPLSLRVKSKKVDLFLLRKKDAMNIKKDYPNIWKRIDDKAMHNMKSIKALTKRIINNYCKMNGILPEMDVLEKSQHLLGGGGETEYSKNEVYSTEINLNKKKKRQSAIFTRKINKVNTNSSIISFSKEKKMNNKRKSNSLITKKKINISKIGENSSIKNKKSNKIFQKKSLIQRHKKINESDSFQGTNKILKGNTVKTSKAKKLKLIKTISRNSSLSLGKSNNKSINNKIKKNNNKEKEKQILQTPRKKNTINKNNLNSHNKTKDNMKMINTSRSEKNLNIKSTHMRNTNQKKLSLNNNKISNNKLHFSNTTLKSQILTSNKDSTLFLLDNNLDNKKNLLIQESTIKIQIISSYKNINKLSHGNYINNKQFQNATQRFVNYYLNSIFKLKQGINEINENDSSIDISSFNAFSHEESFIDKSKSFNNVNKDSDKKINEYKNIKHIKKYSKENINNSISNNSKIGETKFKNKKELKYNTDNKNKLIPSSKQLKSSSIIPNNKNFETNKFINAYFEEENEKEKEICSKNCNSEAKLSNNNSNFFEIGKNLLLKKKEIEDFNKSNNNLKDDKLIYNSSNNIINNKSNKNINEVNINFTNNFCNVF